MSLPLKRRIARAALLAAAAAPVIGMGAGTASAAALPQTPDLGGLSNLDNAVPLGGTVKDAAPVVGGVLGGAGKTAVPATQQAAGNASKALGQVTRQAPKSLREDDLVDSALPVHTSQVPQTAELAQHGLQAVQQLPLQQLPQSLPLQGLPIS